MNLGLDDKVIIVTGGMNGAGEGIVRVLAGEGAIPVIISRDVANARKLQEELERAGRTAFAVQAELSEPAACETAVLAIVKKFGRIEGLVNHAGGNDGVCLENGDFGLFIKSLHNNLVQYYLMTQFALMHLKKSSGAIVNISSITARAGQGNTSAYAAAIGGQNGLTREWSVELLKYGMRVNSVIAAEHGRPEEIGNIAAFLLSEKSSHTTGQLIHMDGGYLYSHGAQRKTGAALAIDS